MGGGLVVRSRLVLVMPNKAMVGTASVDRWIGGLGGLLAAAIQSVGKRPDVSTRNCSRWGVCKMMQEEAVVGRKIRWR